MDISFDPAKRAKTLAERGLDFADAGRVFAGLTMTRSDDRFDYPEPRFQTFGLLDERLVMVVWAEVEERRRIISMRKCNERERDWFAQQLG
ncbi:BrnT family toxin [Sphingomonas corticis]|uniref:BrnT family toxin n=1 Tax=Sphingomonas corticis TaxID=2722791 RepID=A0ABX1CPN0_9SPHN|nr:BrnT family toxin [Sphingomonas corticis]